MSKRVSQYARHMARLSARIFQEPSSEGTSVNRGLSKEASIYHRMSKEPYYKKKEFTQYYPPMFEIDKLMKKIRDLGLFVYVCFFYDWELSHNTVLLY